jgi:hypothetical protein
MALRANLVSHGFVSRRWDFLASDPAHDNISYSAVYLSRSGLGDVQGSHRLCQQAKNIDSLLKGPPDISTQEIPVLKDYSYCDHDNWPKMRLEVDPLNGLSPIQCALCQGIIATYRLKLQDEVANALWIWDNEYELIYNLWLHSSEYEEWAKSQLSRVSSVLNKRGFSLANAIGAQLGCCVDYQIHHCQ